MLNFILAIAIATNGLLAGVFFAFTAGVTRGFKYLDNKTYVNAFQVINTSIENVAFLVVFFLAPATALLAIVAMILWGSAVGVLLTVVAAACSLFTFTATVLVHVPLNRGLKNVPPEQEGRCLTAREGFERQWNRWNLVRTGSATCAMVLLLVAT